MRRTPTWTIRGSKGTFLPTHGETKTPLYRCWLSVKTRCNNPAVAEYPRYGGRGITLCAAWRDYVVFAEWARANGYRYGLEIDRIDNNGDYTPENCRFVTGKVNCNNRRDNRRVLLFGEVKTTTEWSEDPRSRVGYATLTSRIDRGWAVERALTTPPHHYHWLTVFGETKTLAEWSRDARCRVRQVTLRERVRQGCDGERAIIQPPKEC